MDTTKRWGIGEIVYGDLDETEDTFSRSRGYLVHDMKGEFVAIVCGANESYSATTEGAKRARLVAAAPDLRAALGAFVSHYPHGINPDLDAAYSAACDAIDKADGRK